MRPHLLLITVLVSALFSLFSTCERQRSIPAREDWREVTEALSAALRAGDAVTWLPEWAEEGRVALKAVEGRAEVIYPPHHGRLDLGRFRRVWVIGALGYTGAQLVAMSELPTQERAQPVAGELTPEQPLKLLEERRFERLSLSLIEVQGGRVIAELYRDLPHAERVKVTRAHLKGAQLGPRSGCSLWALKGWHCELKRSAALRSLRGSRENKRRALEELTDLELSARCLSRPASERLKTRSKRRRLYTLDRRRHLSYVDCGLHPEEHVSQDHRVIGGEPRRCVWLKAHERRALRLAWRVPPTAGASLSLRYGWEDLAVDPPFRSTQAKPLSLVIHDGATTPSPKPLLEAKLEPVWGWRELSAPLADSAGERELTLSLSAPQGARDAHLCIDLSVRAP